MKILVISNYYPPQFLGGYEISVKESADFLAQRGHEVFILCGDLGCETADHFCPETFICQNPYRILRYIAYDNGSFRQKHAVEKHNYQIVSLAIKRIKPDLVYLGNMKALSIAPVIATQKLKQRKLFDIGDFWFKIYQRPGFLPRLYRALKNLIPFTVGGPINLDPVMVPSQWMKDELLSSKLSSQVYVIPRGIRIPPAFNPQPGASNPGATISFAFAGRIEPKKGLEICFEALAGLKAQKLPFTFDIYGTADPEYQEQCRVRLDSLNLSSQVSFRGKCRSLIKTLANYDFFLMPTLAREAFGRVIIESMAAGAIVIASDRFGPSEIIQNRVTGFLFETGSATALGRTIKQALRLPTEKLDRVRKQARKTVEAKYDLALVKKSVEDLIVNIIDNKTSPEV